MTTVRLSDGSNLNCRRGRFLSVTRTSGGHGRQSWESEVAGEIAEVAAASDDAAGDDIAA